MNHYWRVRQMDKIKCPNCGNHAVDVIHAETHTRKGWYCCNCRHFEVAIGRERIVDHG